jgi:hypothetical protein
MANGLAALGAIVWQGWIFLAVLIGLPIVLSIILAKPKKH